MNIIIISILALWLICTEVIYILFRKDGGLQEDWYSDKFLAMFLGFVSAGIIFGFSYMPYYGFEKLGYNGYICTGAVYLGLIIFFGSNYLIDKYINRPKKRKKK